MAIFHKHWVRAPPSGKGEVLCTSWSPPASGPALLAVGTSGHANIYLQEGAPLHGEGEASIKAPRGQDPTVLAWHPQQRLLAIGWKDGALSFWKEQDRKLLEDTSTHRSQITCLSWNAEGTRLVSGDVDGKVGVFKLDARGKPAPVTRYSEGATKTITHICFDTCAAPPPEFIDPALPPPCPPFYYAVATSDKGVICHADDKGHKAVAYEVDAPVVAMLYYPERNGVVAITTSLMLTVHTHEGASWILATKVKLTRSEDVLGLEATWAGSHILALASDKDTVVRISNLQTEENSTLSLPEDAGAKTGHRQIAALAYNDQTATLAAGARDGLLYRWKRVGEPSGDGAEARLSPAAGTGEDQQLKGLEWERQESLDLGSPFIDVVWGAHVSLIGAVVEDGVVIVAASPVQHRLRSGRAVVQIDASKIVVESTDPGATSSNQQVLASEMDITGADIWGTKVMLWSSQQAEVYEVGLMGVRLLSKLPMVQGADLALHSDSVFRTQGPTIEVCNLQGTVKQTLQLDEALGKASRLDVCEEFLVAATSNGFVKMWKIGGREAKPHGPGSGRKVEVNGAPVGEILAIRCNFNGTKIGILANTTGERCVPDSRLFVYDTEIDSFLTYDFRPFQRTPEAIYWDGEEAKLLACKTRLNKSLVLADGLPFTGREEEEQVTTLFATSDHGILYQDKVERHKDWRGFLGLQVPYLYFHGVPTFQAKESASTLSGPTIRRDVMRDFAGMENADAKTRKGLLGFSYHLAIGNMDEAYKAVKLIKNPGVWENMAQLCVKTKRMDVAKHCLGNMGHARAARFVREAQVEPELDALVAAVAVQLGLQDDAQKLYVNCERWDLLNQMYQACGAWQKALEVAGKHDRIHLRSTYFNYARYLEAMGDIQGAIKAYQASDTHGYEVPRMLFDAGSLDELQTFIHLGGDKEIITWWAKYCESQGDLDKARECYDWAGDHQSMVRLHCFQGNFSAAAEIVDKTGDLLSSFHLARQYELQENIPQAIHYFTKAERFRHAVRLAQRYSMDSDLLSLALQGSPQIMLSSARYFEERGSYDKAVMLYHKGGNLSRAVDLCFHGQLFDSLRTIVDNMKEVADPALLARCADFFLEHQQFEKAAHLFIASKKHDRALDLCVEHGITITEDMAEAMTPSKGDNERPDERLALLRRLAKCCKEQGSYHLACKKYTQAGDRLKAMKVLLKSGDTEKIIFFANVSRQRELYVLAANYLQSLDWHGDPEIMKAIIQFYTKAGAMESLASFYEACAQIEIDEYRDYEKALGALREGLKYLSKARGDDKDARISSLTKRTGLVEKFVQARKLAKTDPAQMVASCNAILDQIPPATSEFESAVRAGDVFALIVEYHNNQGDIEQAYQYIEKMHDRNIVIGPYLDHDMVQGIYKAMGIELVTDELETGADINSINEEIGRDE